LADKTGKTGDVWKKRRKEMEKQQTENKATRLINDKQKKIDEELRQYEEQIKVLYNKVKGVIKKFGDKIRAEFIAQIEEFHILYHGKTAITFEQNINDKLSPLGMDVKCGKRVILKLIFENGKTLFVDKKSKRKPSKSEFTEKEIEKLVTDTIMPKKS